MENETVAPDFNMEMSDYDKEENVWESSPEHSGGSATPDRDRQQSKSPEAQTEPAGLTTDQLLKKLLKVDDSRTGADGPIPPRRLKRRRVSRSRSLPVGEDLLKEKSEKPAYSCPTRIRDIFDRQISSKELCALSAITCGSPETVRKIIPGASVDQICRMVKL